MALNSESSVIRCLLMASMITASSGADILLVPFAHGFNSRLMNMEKIADLLHSAGHRTNILINSVVEDKVTNKNTKWYVYDVPEGLKVRQATDRDFIELMMYGPKDNGLYSMVQAWIDFEIPFCEALLGEGKMLPTLKARNFDLMILDVGDDCGRIIADYLDIPTMLYSNYGFSHDYKLFYPQPFTYVCPPEIPEVCTSDEMDFGERTANFIAHMIMEFLTTPYLLQQYDTLRQKHKLNETLKSGDSFNKHVVLANADYAIDFPRPVMPHMITVSGIFRKPAKPLPVDLETFFESSGDEGVVVLSFGTLISALDEHQTEIIARVFSRLPQKVLWRHSGNIPEGLGKNTLLKGWIPQNDVLAHPKTVLFITHCGIASTFESAINGVPVVTVPLFADQKFNSARLVNRAKMGVQINIHTLNEAELENAIKTVLGNPAYKENAIATSKLMHDAPVSPKDLFLYWVDFVIRHKGARHLQSGPARRMNWLQYTGLDVILMLIVMFIGTLLAFITCVFCTCKCILKCFNSKKYKRL